MFGYGENHGVKGYRSRRALHNQATPGAANCFHHMGELSTAVSQEHETILNQSRCDPTTREVLEVLPKMLQIDPKKRWTAKTARDQFKRILLQADREMASPNRDSHSGEAPARQSTTPSRSNTVSSDTGSPLAPYINPKLSTPKEGTRRDTTAGASPKFDKTLTDSPRNMTINSDTNVDGLGSLDIAQGLEQAFQNKSRNGEAYSSVVHPLVLPDRTGQSKATKESQSEKQTPALMSPFQGAAQISPNHLQSLQPDMSDRNNNTQSTPNTSRAAVDRADAENRPSSAQNQEVAAAPKSPIPPTPPARLAFRDALKWRTDMKAQRSATELPNSHLLKFLEGRDHVSSRAGIVSRTSEHTDRVSRSSWLMTAKLCAISALPIDGNARVRSLITSMF